MRNANRLQRNILRACLAALLSAALLLSSLSALALDGAGGDCIVKYKAEAAYLLEDARVPFDVVSAAEALRLDRAGLLEYYEPDGVACLLEDAPDPAGSEYYESAQWDLDLVGAEEAFRRGFLGQGVRVGVIDSGVSPHPALSDRLLPGANYIEGAADATETFDQYGHGTAVAGLIAGAGEQGYVGAAPAAELVPLKVTDGRYLKVSAVCRAIYGGVDDFGCDVLNLSLGVTGEYDSLREAVDYAEAQGVLLVAAAGNNGRTTLYYPAAYESVICVGSVDRNGEIASSSTHNASLLLAAPGVEVRSLGSSGGYAIKSGTSFAVPHVAAAAAVLLSIDDALTPAELRQTLFETATDAGAAGWDENYGYGILDLSGCVAALAGPYEPPEPEESDTPCAFTRPTRLRNYTDEDILCTYLLAEYDEAGRCLGIRSWDFTVPARDYVEITPPEENAFYGQFVYETATMTPLANARTSLST